MILTVTLNPAWDVTYTIDTLETGRSYRVVPRGRAGGKGVNASRVLHQLGHHTLATGLLGGQTGLRIARELDDAGVPHRFGPVLGESRTSVAVVSRSVGDATVFNELGPEIGADEWSAFVVLFDELVSTATVVLMSGSLPVGVPEDAYAVLARRSPVPVLIDTSGRALLAAASAGAVLLPNRDELAEATGDPDPATGSASLIRAGAHAVIVSCGADGIYAVTPDGAWELAPAKALSGNPTGAGDALAAALAATHGRPWAQRLTEGVAWSAAAVVMPAAGEVDPVVADEVRGAARPRRIEVPS